MVEAQHVIDALKESHDYFPRVYFTGTTEVESCVAVAIPRSTDMLDLAAKLIEGGLYTDRLAELGLTMKVDRTGLHVVLYWPNLKLTPAQVDYLAGGEAEEFPHDLTHYI